MKAIGVSEYGDIDNLKMLDMPDLEVSKGRIIIKTEAFALNPYDVGIIDGSQAKFRPLTLPAIPGSDVAGVVVDKDPSVTEFKIGERIVGRANLAGYAEYVSVPHLRAVSLPDEVNFSTAAALPNAGVSAYDIVFGALKDHAYNSVLVIGATGAVGSIVTQILTNEKKQVSVVLNSNKKHELPISPNFEVAYYDQPNTIDQLSQFDVIINAAPQTDLAVSYAKHLNSNGILLSTTGTDRFGLLPDQTIDFNDANYKLNHSALEYLVNAVKNGQITIKIAEELNFNVKDVSAALKIIRTHHPAGKYIVKL